MRENKVQVDENKLCKDLFNYIKNETEITRLINLPELKENTLKWTIAQKPKIIFEVSPIPLYAIYINNLEIGYTHASSLFFKFQLKN
jgi:hypothetical protein